MGLLLCLLLLCGGGRNPILAGEPPALLINEIRTDQPGTDTDEYFELVGEPGTTLEGIAYLVIGDGPSGGSGIIEEAIDLSGQTLSASGFLLVGPTTLALASPDLVVDLNFENLDNVTHLLVEGFSGSENQDLDPDDNGILDILPWTRLLDLIAIISEENPPASTEFHYGPPTAGPAETGGPWHVLVCEGAWRVGATDPGSGEDTPRAANICSATPADPCEMAATFIHEIQGSGASSPMDGMIGVSVQGIVVGDYQGSGKLGGFFLQEETEDSDSDPETSEGLFVFDNNFGVDVAVGDLVRVTGRVTEFDSLTELTAVTQVRVCAQSLPLPPATPVDLPLADLEDWEAFEGMRISVPGPLTVSDSYHFGRYGQAVLSIGGRLFQPTQVTEPRSQALERLDLNERSRITIDDGSRLQYPEPPVPPLGPGVTLRAGDTTDDVGGVLDFRSGRYLLLPSTPPLFTPSNPRATEPPAIQGSMRVASFNIGNYFTTLNTGGALCGPSGNIECRGASTIEEFTRQRAKILAALTAMDADILALIEVENDSGETLTDLVSGLNSMLGAGTYSFLDTGPIGTDAIRNAILFKPSTVLPVGPYAVLDSSVDSRFNDIYNRPSLAQTFEGIAQGERFTVAVNHFKSKGSSCEVLGDPDGGDGQGDCNGTRTAAAMALRDWLATDPTESDDPDVLLLGDLNAYAREDPIAVLRSAGYADLVDLYAGPQVYSLVLDGQAGLLDHALASASLAVQAEDTVLWAINADEPSVFSYRNFNPISFYNPDPYRSSDHDPVIVGLSPRPLPTATSTATPAEGGTPTSIPTPTSTDVETPTPIPTSTVTGPAPTETPTLTFDWDLSKDDRIDAKDLLKALAQPPPMHSLFDFSRFWKIEP